MEWAKYHRWFFLRDFKHLLIFTLLMLAFFWGVRDGYFFLEHLVLYVVQSDHMLLSLSFSFPRDLWTSLSWLNFAPSLMGWGNIYRRRLKVFSVAVVIYLNYKVKFLDSHFHSELILGQSYSLAFYHYWRLFNKERNGLTKQEELLYGKRLMNAMLSVFSVW